MGVEGIRELDLGLRDQAGLMVGDGVRDLEKPEYWRGEGDGVRGCLHGDWRRGELRGDGVLRRDSCRTADSL